VARDLGRRQRSPQSGQPIICSGPRRENIQRDLRPTGNAGAAPKIRHPPGWQQQRPLAALLLGHSPMVGMLPRRALP